MSYDEALADRVRAAIADVADVTEIKMFGGLCYTVRGHMAVGVNGDELMVRLSKEDGDAALSEPGARPMDFTGSPMRGFLFVGPAGHADEDALQSWVDRSVAFASTLPPKKPKSKPTSKAPAERTKVDKPKAKKAKGAKSKKAKPPKA